MDSGYGTSPSPSGSSLTSEGTHHGLESLHIYSPDDLMGNMLNIGNGFNTKSGSFFETPLYNNVSLEIIEEPVDKFRFRYKSEMHGTHGSLMGQRTEKSKKSFPTVELRGYNKPAIIRCSLYQTDVLKPLQHSHRLVVRKGDQDINDPHDVSVSPDEGFRAVFQGMGIIHTAKKHIVEELIAKKEKEKRFELGRQLTTRESAQIRSSAEQEAKSMNLNQVCLGFQAFGVKNEGTMFKLCEPVFSKPINNMKSALTGELKISRLSAVTSTVAGGEDLFLLVEKVGKKNIKVRFFEVDENNEEVWEGYGSFSEADVHHQYAIALRTPPYKDQNIDKNVQVYIQLVRPSDDDRSIPLQFKYKPRDCVISRKRARMSSSCYSSSELPEPVAKEFSVGPGTISEEFNKKEFIHDFLENVKMNSNELKGLMDEPFQDFDELLSLQLDGIAKKKSVASYPPKSLPTSQMKTMNSLSCTVKKMFEIMRQNTADTARAEILNLFLNANANDDDILHRAIANGDSGTMVKLLNLIDKLNLYGVLQYADERKETCLHIACLNDKAEYIRPLINLGADPNKADIRGNTPLHVAVEENMVLCVSKIIDKNNYTEKSRPLQIDLANDDGLTALHLAARNGNLVLVEKLLEIGKASTKICVAKNGNNVLHIAVEQNDINMVKYLLENTTVHVNEPNTSGFKPIQIAHSMGKNGEEIFELLLKYTDDSSYSIKSYSTDSNPESLQSMEDSSEEDDDENALRIDEDRDVYFNDCFNDEDWINLRNLLNRDDAWKVLAQQLNIFVLKSRNDNSANFVLNYVKNKNFKLCEILNTIKHAGLLKFVTFINEKTKMYKK